MAAVWVAGATVPLLGAAVFLVGCCILPFHGLMHELMPVCETAAGMVAGGHGDDHDASPVTPAREKEPVKRLLSVPAANSTFDSVARVAIPLAVTASAAPRSFMTLGAVRCDQDVGLHLLDATFLI